MGEIHQNTFGQGLNKDSAKSVVANQSYSHAENMRLYTDSGESVGGIINVKGNKLITHIPPAPAIVVITVAGSGNSTVGNITSAVDDIVNETTGVDVYASGAAVTSVKELADEIEDYFTKNYAGALTFNSVRENEANILVWLTDPRYEVNAAGCGVTYTVGPLNYTVTFTEKVARQTGLEIIGSTTIRDDVYLFCTNNDTDSGGPGSIWKFTYDEETLTQTGLEIIYHGNVFFTKKKKIKAIGKYENARVQRLYWTDNLNPPRSLNVGDPNAMAVDEDFLGLQTPIVFGHTYLNKIVSGTLPTGMYMYAYRLKGNGKITRFSPPSGIYHCVGESEYSAYYFRYNEEEYRGEEIGLETTKGFEIKIEGIDPEYDTIEIAALYWRNKNQDPEVALLQEAVLPAGTTYTFTHTGNEGVSTIPVEEFIAFSTLFDKAKSIEAKDNRLFFANVSTEKFNKLVMNARAYRFRAANVTYVSDDIYDTGTLTWATGVEDEDPDDLTTFTKDDVDAINPFNDPAYHIAAAPGTALYKYQSDGTTLGGEGPNVSYQFYKFRIAGDTKYPGHEAWQPAYAPLVDTQKNETQLALETRFTDDSELTFPVAGQWRNFKSPIVSGHCKGYARGEIYRFGLILWDKFGRPSYVQWIGDIRMPEAFDSDTLGAGPSYANFFNVSFEDRTTNDYQWLFSIGVQFDITIPLGLRDDILGYSVVRVPRDEDNKTRVAMGLLGPVYQENGGASSIPSSSLCLLGEESGASPNQVFEEAARRTNAALTEVDITDKVVTFDSPDFQLAQLPGYLQRNPSNHAIRVQASLVDLEDATYRLRIINGDGSGPTQTYTKLHGDASSINNAHSPVGDSGVVGSYAETPIYWNVNDFNFCESAQSCEIDDDGGTERVFYNYAYDDVAVTGDKYRAAGNRTTVLKLQTTVDWPNATAQFDANMNRLLAAYCRKVENQYGGNTLEDRSNNTYLWCGHFQPYDEDVSATLSTNVVLGGDIYVGNYGNTKLEQYAQSLSQPSGWPDSENVGGSAQGELGMYGLIFPCESSINFELRNGWHLLNKYQEISGSPTFPQDEQYFDQFLVEDLYSSVYNNVSEFFPKPLFVDFQDQLDTRIYASDKKISGERIDSWTQVFENNQIDLDGQFGQINEITVFRDTMFAVQDDAFAQVVINPNSLVQDDGGSSILLGVGAVLQDFNYISTKYGSRHQWSVIATEGGIYFVDAKRKMIHRFSQGLESVSSTKGLAGFIRGSIEGSILTLDEPCSDEGIHVGYDARYHEVLFTFLSDIGGEQTNFTLVFSELINQFSSLYDCTPKIYISDNKNLFSPILKEYFKKDGSSYYFGDTLYTHNEGPYGSFYDTVYDSSIKFVVNPNPGYTKVFDNFGISLETTDAGNDTLVNRFKDGDSSFIEYLNEGAAEIRVYNDYQNTDYLTLTPGLDIKRVEREWQFAIPRNALKDASPHQDLDIFLPANIDTTRTFRERMRDKYIVVDIRFDNDDNRRKLLNYVKTFYRVSRA